MEKTFELFQNLKEKHLIKTNNPNLNEILYEFSFFFVKDEKELDIIIKPQNQ